MPKISLKLDTRRSLDGTDSYPLVFTVSHKGQTAFIPSGYHLNESQWIDLQAMLEGRRRKGVREKIIEEKFERLKRILELFIVGGKAARAESATVLRNMLLDADRNNLVDEPSQGRAEVKDSSSRFLPYYTSIMEDQLKKGTRDIYLRTKKLIERYCQEKGEDPDVLTFGEIDAGWLRSFDEWMSPTNGVNSRSINMRNIRAVFNAAIEDGLKIEYPFSRVSSRRSRRDGRKKFRIESDKHPRKRALTLEQVRVLKDLELPEWQREYRDMFMLMVYLIGINAVDLLTARPSQLRSGRLEYDRRKTGTPYSIKVEPEALAIIKRYRGKSFLLSPCDRYKDYRNYLHHMNDALKKLGIHYENRQRPSGEPLFPELSTYWARHTWSSVAANLGVAKDINGKAMGHAWASDTVTDIYISIDPILIDNANREVIDAICFSNE